MAYHHLGCNMRKLEKKTPGIKVIVHLFVQIFHYNFIGLNIHEYHYKKSEMLNEFLGPYFLVVGIT
jgi:hypothetical protein